VGGGGGLGCTVGREMGNTDATALLQIMAILAPILCWELRLKGGAAQ
jgi:hypothetical protein